MSKAKEFINISEGSSYKEETLALAKKRIDEIKDSFLGEVEHLLNSGGVDPDNHSRGRLFGVALENIADRFLRGERNNKAYKNLKHF